MIEYVDGKMIITHKSEHVDTYNKADVVKDLNRKQARLTKIQTDVSRIESMVQSIDDSVTG